MATATVSSAATPSASTAPETPTSKPIGPANNPKPIETAIKAATPGNQTTIPPEPIKRVEQGNPSAMPKNVIAPLSPELMQQQVEQHYRDAVIAVAKGEDIPPQQIQMACFNAQKTPATFNVDLKRLQERIQAAKNLEEAKHAEAMLAQANRDVESAREACKAARIEAERVFRESMRESEMAIKRAEERHQQLSATWRRASDACGVLYRTGDPAIDDEARQASGVSQVIARKGCNRDVFAQRIEIAKQDIQRLEKLLSQKPQAQRGGHSLGNDEIQRALQDYEAELRSAKASLAHYTKELEDSRKVDSLVRAQNEKVQEILNQKLDPFRMKWSE